MVPSRRARGAAAEAEQVAAQPAAKRSRPEPTAAPAADVAATNGTAGNEEARLKFGRKLAHPGTCRRRGHGLALGQLGAGQY